jgi:hypothetical protein
VIETLRKGKTKVADPTTGSGKIPNGAVLTPTSMETLDLFRVGGSTTTDGPFLVNPFGGAQRTLWGMALVEEPGMTATKAVVGYFRDAVLWDRQQATSRSSRSTRTSRPGTSCSSSPNGGARSGCCSRSRSATARWPDRALTHDHGAGERRFPASFSQGVRP